MTLELTGNIRIGLKSVKGTNALAYLSEEERKFCGIVACMTACGAASNPVSATLISSTIFVCARRLKHFTTVTGTQ
jgi:hypothetical protein